MSIFENASFSSVLGGISGGVVAWLVSLSVNKKQSKDASAEIVDDLLIELKSRSKSYWIRLGVDGSREEDLVSLSARCRDKLLRYAKKSGLKELESAVNSRWADLHTEITGGAFATQSRSADAEKARRIEQSVENFRKLLP